MSSDLMHVADKIRSGVRQLEWVVQLAEAMERIGSLEQAERETTERVRILREQADRFDAEIAEHNARIEDAKQRCDEEVKRARKEVSEQYESARAEIDKQYTAAEKQREAMLNGAKHEIASARADAERVLRDLNKQASELRRVLRDIEAKIESGNNTLQGLTEKIDQTKSRAREMFGL